MKVFNWKEIEITALATGSLREAARLHNVSEANVRQRAHRYKWPLLGNLDKQLEATQKQMAAQAQIISKKKGKTMKTVSAMEALATLIQEKHSDYRKSMATTLASAAKAVESMPPKEQFKEARKLDSLASAGGKVFGTPDGQVQRLSIFNIPQLQRVERSVEGNVIEAEEV